MNCEVLSQPLEPNRHSRRLRSDKVIQATMAGKTRSALQDVVTREFTIHLHKYVHGRSFKKRAPTAVKSVVAFAQREMGTSDVRIDPKLNQALWSRGIKSWKRNDEENAKEKLYTYATHVPTASFKVGLLASSFFGIPVVT
ncbi:ribosomal protein L31e-domain-containing protein [Lactarius akahatsu]|uniref:Ribosomal protein L31e-domain-containing protein n=1 Tax=Lactarius akahatsu TaxID=416441 RepID=A0AAD4QD57_9AGAM|nr:ribosomal protein L31e-domain-containing protein [Lactarius akahatsu]